MQARTPDHRTITHAHLFCSVGGGARGFNQATARVGTLEADFRCLGGIDVDAAAIRDFGRLAGVPGTCLDLFDREQYRAFHGHEPPADWQKAGPERVRRAFSGERPHILFLSAPCKGFSGLLSEGKSKLAKYQALNRLTLRGIWLALEAYRDDPVELILFEKFTDRTDALTFAQSKMGRTGMIAETTLMSDEQLKAHRAREARACALLAEMKP